MSPALDSVEFLRIRLSEEIADGERASSEETIFGWRVVILLS